MRSIADLRRQAQFKLKRLEKMRAEPRFKKVVGRLKAEKLLFGGDIPLTHGTPTLDDALWAGELEPRILELLPAILLRRPRLFIQIKPVPDDLADVIGQLRRGKAIVPFRGIPAEKYARWIDRVSYRNKRKPGILKAHRFSEEDQQIIKKLERAWNENETAVLRRAIRIAAEKL